MQTLENYLQENYKTKNLKTLIKRFTDYQNGKEENRYTKGNSTIH